MARYVTLATMEAYDTVNAQTVTLYVGTSGGFVTGPADSPANTVFLDRLKQSARVRRAMFMGGTTRGRSGPAIGEAIVRNADGELDAWRNYAFDGRAYTEYYGPETGTFPTSFTATVWTMDQQPDFSVSDIRFKLRDRHVETQVPLQTTKYAGDNVLPDGLEGTEDLKGKPKPWLFGDVFNIPLPCVNTSKLIYEISANAASAVSDVRDRGISLVASDNSWTSRTSGVVTVLHDVEWGDDGYWVIVGASGVVRYSTTADGSGSWSAASSPGFGAETVRCVIYEPVSGNWIAGSTNQGLRYASDPTGTWSAASTNPFGAAETIVSLAVDGLGNAVAGGSANNVAYSTDGGVNWTASTESLGGSIYVAFGNGRFGAIDSTGQAAYSTDGGANFTNGGTVTSTLNPAALAWGPNGFVTCGPSGVEDSPDMIRWTKRYFDSTTTYQINVRAVTYGGPMRKYFIVGGTTGNGAAIWSGASAAQLFQRDASGWSTDQINGVGQNTAGVIVVGAGGKLFSAKNPAAYGSLADLEDDTLAPIPGTYKYYLSSSGSYVRLGSAPAGLVTADVLHGANAAARTAGQGFAAVMSKIGLGSDYSTSDVTTLDASRTDVIGFWSGLQEWMANDVLDEMANSVEAWWGPDTSGSFRIQTGPATSGTPVLSIAEEDMTEPPRLLPTNDEGNGLPAYRVVVRYRKNYAPQENDLAYGVTDANRALYSTEWREEVVTTSSVQTAYTLAREIVVETLLATSASASSSATRRAAVYDSRHDILEFPVEYNADTDGIELGNVITVTHSRFGFSAGVSLAIIGLEPDRERKRLTIQGWRAA